jgi:hypothetical protein
MIGERIVLSTDREARRWVSRVAVPHSLNIRCRSSFSCLLEGLSEQGAKKIREAKRQQLHCRSSAEHPGGIQRMQRKEITYNGRQIVIDSQNGECQVTIDEEHIPAQHVPETGEYIATQHSPFISHDSLEALAKHVVDHVINHRRE